MNNNVCDFVASKRRNDSALRMPPTDSGRRDPDGRPRFDPDGRAYRDAVAHLAAVLDIPGTPPAVRASLEIVLNHQREDAA